MRAASGKWAQELEGDPDAEYIMEGVLNGFMLVDLPQVPPDIICKNYKSTRDSHEQVQAQILNEIQAGNYLISHHKPRVVSALGAIPKADSDKLRIIHDLSRGGVNALAADTSVAYPSVDDALKLMSPSSVIAK